MLLRGVGVRCGRGMASGCNNILHVSAMHKDTRKETWCAPRVSGVALTGWYCGSVVAGFMKNEAPANS